MQSTDARVLVVTNNESDADMICELLDDVCPNVTKLTAVDRLASNFDRVQPQVLILGFKSVADSERHYQNLFRDHAATLPTSYRTILLCTKEEVARAYALCSSNQFDDYVMFWPLVYDASRLAMAVHLALRAGDNTQTERLLAQITSQARRVADLEKQLDIQLKAGAAFAEEARHTLTSAHDHVGAAIQHFSSRLFADEAAKGSGAGATEQWRAEIDRLQDELVMPPLKAALDASEPVQDWVVRLRDELERPLAAARELADTVEELQRTLLVVDDDEFMRKLLSLVLTGANYRVVAVGSGHDALSALRNRLPDLIIMDVNLPDINGIEVTRRLKSTEEYARIPVIMLTGQSEKNVLLSSRSVGAIDFVVKPFDREVLLRKVSRRLMQ